MKKSINDPAASSGVLNPSARIKILSLFTAFLLISAAPVFSQSELDELKSRLDSFSEAMALSLPFNSTIGLNWSDAYIGQFLRLPPHFGAGLSVGVTALNIE